MPMKAIKWLLMRHRPLVIRPMLDPGDVALAGPDAAQLHRGALRRQQGAHGARWPNTAATACASCAPTTGIAYDERSQGTLQLFRTQKQLDGVGERHRGAEAATACRTRCSTATAASRPSRRWPACADKFVGGLRLPGDETGDCFNVHRSAWPSMARRCGVDVPLRRRRSSGWSTEGGTHHRRARPTQGVLTADAYVVALGSYSPLLLRPLGICDAGLSGQGLLDHRADHRRRRRAGIDGDGRDLQGRDHAARRPHPRRRHGGNRRLRPAACASRAGDDAGACRSPTCSRAAATLAQAEFWIGLRPMTPDGTPVVGPTPLPQPVPQHRPRHAGLDHGLR